MRRMSSIAPDWNSERPRQGPKKKEQKRSRRSRQVGLQEGQGILAKGPEGGCPRVETKRIRLAHAPIVYVSILRSKGSSAGFPNSLHDCIREPFRPILSRGPPDGKLPRPPSLPGCQCRKYQPQPTFYPCRLWTNCAGLFGWHSANRTISTLGKRPSRKLRLPVEANHAVCSFKCADHVSWPITRSGPVKRTASSFTTPQVYALGRRALARPRTRAN
jgi:hypothetical protein